MRACLNQETDVHPYMPTPSFTALSGRVSSISGWLKPSSLVYPFLLWGQPEPQAGPRQALELHHLSTCVVHTSEVPTLFGINHSSYNPEAAPEVTLFWEWCFQQWDKPLNLRKEDASCLQQGLLWLILRARDMVVDWSPVSLSSHLLRANHFSLEFQCHFILKRKLSQFGMSL